MGKNICVRFLATVYTQDVYDHIGNRSSPGSFGWLIQRVTSLAMVYGADHFVMTNYTMGQKSATFTCRVLLSDLKLILYTSKSLLRQKYDF